jgi:predicted phosphohydrolase
MSLFVIGDPHLSFSVNKPMDVFKGWTDYTDRLRNNWNNVVGEGDSVVVAGDISWAMNFEEAKKDFAFLNELNGTKYIIKGNHDYWWTTPAKMNKFLLSNGFDSIKILQNTAHLYGDTAICGTRGWTIPPVNSTSENVKIFEREKQRLILSLEDAKARHAKEIIAALHYPPIEGSCNDFLEILKAYNVKTCLFGHLHGAAHKSAPVGEVDGIKLKLVACDYLNFIPALIQK